MGRPPPMTDSNGGLGACPQCGREIPPAYLLIEYELEDDTVGQWAECPECEEVVDPDA